MAEDSATESQANLEVTNQGTLRLLNDNDDCETWSNLQLVWLRSGGLPFVAIRLSQIIMWPSRDPEANTTETNVQQINGDKPSTNIYLSSI